MGLPKGKRKMARGGMDEPRINDELRGSYDVRVVYKGRNGDEPFSEVLSLYDAKRRAEAMGLDIIETNTKSVPPIMLIDNYSKWRFERKKNEKGKQKQSQVKEVQLTTNISDHDMETKAKAAARFISEGDKVRVVLKMRGRELGRREQSKRSLYMFITMLEEVAVPESMPKDEGNKCVAILKKKAGRS